MHDSSTGAVCIPLFEANIYLKKSIPLLIHFSLHIHIKQRGDNICIQCLCVSSGKRMVKYLFNMVICFLYNLFVQCTDVVTLLTAKLKQVFPCI
jgi:hypothetical protein